MTSTLDALREQYGAVMTLEQLADTLSRKREGLRMALLNPRDTWAVKLNQTKVFIGRRMYFPVESVAELLEGKLGATQVDRSDVLATDTFAPPRVANVVAKALAAAVREGLEPHEALRSVLKESMANFATMYGSEKEAINAIRTFVDLWEKEGSIRKTPAGYLRPTMTE